MVLKGTIRVVVQWINCTTTHVVGRRVSDVFVHVQKTSLIVFIVTEKTREIRCVTVYHETIKWELKKRLVYECRCDERLKVKIEISTHLTYTVLCGGHVKLLSWEGCCRIWIWGLRRTPCDGSGTGHSWLDCVRWTLEIKGTQFQSVKTKGTQFHYVTSQSRHIHEVVRQLVPTSLSPDPSHLLNFHFEGWTKEVINLINRPVVSLLGTQVGGTSVVVVPKRMFPSVMGECVCLQDKQAPNFFLLWIDKRELYRSYFILFILLYQTQFVSLFF